MIDDPGVYGCVLCYDTIFNVICMILCDQEKKIRKEKKRWCDYKDWSIERRGRWTLRQRTVSEVEQRKIDNGSLYKHRTKLCLLSGVIVLHDACDMYECCASLRSTRWDSDQISCLRVLQHVLSMLHFVYVFFRHDACSDFVSVLIAEI